jgi:hypothetical protein
MYTYTAIKHKEKFWNVKNWDSAVINGFFYEENFHVRLLLLLMPPSAGRIYIVGGLRQV